MKISVSATAVTTPRKVRAVSIWLVAKWIAAFLVALIAILPIWWMINVVFSVPGEPVSINPRLYPTSLGDGWAKISMVLTETEYFRAYLISLLYALLTITGVLIFGSMAAFEFALFEFPGKRTFFAIVMLSLMVPTAVTIIPTYLLTAQLGWLNTMQGLVVPGLSSAFGLFLLVQFMRSIPRDMIEAARLDGAGHFQIYWHVVIPLSKNALITLAILTFIQTWGNYMWPLIISSDPQMYTVGQVVGLFNSPLSHHTVDIVMTANLLAAIPPLVFFLIFQRKIVEGVAMSGTKG
ncbi:carbohydrate ABC transporter permease [Pelagibacterium xiamenense]|uniref:carbohydrate ABC transporter permease n=1 Tax=Pelagibacterium xiamenense TaxID=2901140 RepID=UPI001E35E408|nr:carbohydrate ABC transporter permease [Pelagibacterium xiamenense]MCD7060653.1 carbohydrate ABC transporter permease [Pelagibacterium xiamenense]